MSEIVPAAVAALAQAEQLRDPFEGFKTEAFVAGEPDKAEKLAAPAPAAVTAPDPAVEEGTSAEPEGAPAATEGTDGASRKQQTAQERINELTRKHRQAERDAEAWRKRAEEAEQARSAPAREAPPREAPQAKEDASATKGPPSPDDFEFGELDSAYIAAVVEYHTDRRIEEFRQQEAQKREQAAQAERQQTVQQKWQQRIESGKQKYADFDTVVVQGAEAEAWALSDTLGALLAESDVGDDIAYHLATNPAEAEQVFYQSPVDQARYFGRLEAKFSAARAAATGGAAAETPATTRAPRAPAPIETPRGSGGRFQTSAAANDFAAFEAAVNGK